MKFFYILISFLISFFISNNIIAQGPGIEWQKCLGGTSEDIARVVRTTADNGYIIAGYVESRTGDVSGHNGGMYDFWVVKLTNNGTIQWSKCLGGSNFDMANDIVQTTDEGFVVAGGTRSSDGNVSINYGNYDYWMVKLTRKGNIEWNKSFGGPEAESIQSIQTTNDGGFILAGSSFSNGFTVNGAHGQTDFWVIKTDGKGNVTWQKGLGGFGLDDASSIKITNDGSYIVAGSSTSDNNGGNNVSSNHGGSDYWVVKLSATGTIEWQKSFGGSSQEIGEAITPTMDGGYIMVGSTVSNNGDVTGNHTAGGVPSIDCWVVKMSATGVLEWQKSLGGSGTDIGYDVMTVSDKTFIIAGKTDSKDGDVSGGKGSADAWVISLSASGDIIWNKCYGGSHNDIARSVKRTGDGNLIFTGQTSSNNFDVSDFKGSVDYWVVKLGGVPACIPGIFISANPGEICQNTSTTFSAYVTFGGTQPHFQWKVNGINGGADSSSFTTSSLKNNDVVTCRLNGTASCAAVSTVESNPVTMTVHPNPIVSIVGDSCLGSTLSLTSGIPPYTLTWILNDAEVQTRRAGFEANGVTVAGGNGIGANANQFNKPTRFYLDTAGNLYIPDMDNNRIQKWVPGASTGITVAGGNGRGSAANQLDRPTSVFFDSKGIMYITDQNNNRIQMWSPGATSGVTLQQFFSTPTDIFIDANDNLYISEQNASRVIKTTTALTTITVVAGGNNYGSAANQLSSPTGIFIDAAGNVYVCDTDNNRVQKWAPNATAGITIGANTGSDLFRNPISVFVDEYGGIYVADYNNARVQLVDNENPYGVTVAGVSYPGSAPDMLDHPESVWIDANGDLIVSDLSNHRIQKFKNKISKIYTPLIEGSYTAKVVTTKGCSNTSNPIVIVSAKTPSVSITAISNAICPGVPITFTSTNGYGGTQPSYKWKINGIAVGTDSAALITSSAKAGDKVTCEMTSNYTGCISTKTVVSNTIDLIPASTGVASVKISAGDTTVCQGTPVTFSATPGNAGSAPVYEWKVNGIAQATNTSTFTTAALNNDDVVSCMMTSSANLCPDALTANSNPVVIHVIPKSIASLQITASDTLICVGDRIEFTAIATNTGTTPVYQWKVNGQNVGSNSSVYNSASLKNNDVVSCVLTSNVPCLENSSPSSNLVRVVVDDYPVITVRKDTVIFKGSNLQLTSTITGNIKTIVWTPASSLNNAAIVSPVASPAASTIYKVTASTMAGCTSGKQLAITVIENITIPNAFSPNGDGINDQWIIPGLSSYTDCRVEIFDRYGQPIFQSKGYNTPWNGTHNGKPLPVGTYYFIITTGYAGEKKSGSITLIK